MKKLIVLVSIISLMSCEKQDLNEAKLDIEESFWFSDIVDYDFNSYLDTFIKVGSEHGVDLNYIYDNEIIIELIDGHDYAGTAYERDNDNKIHIKINKEFYDKITPLYRWSLLFHEFGHDILNYAHKDGISIDGLHLMNQMKNRNIYEVDDLKNSLDEMFKHYKENFQAN